ncbi:MAG TPA: hypothetical protein PLE99_11220 [Candidatus Thiothrix moscowensis]|uniref:hypothetical protein n=1 Tax=unclassified Thiothrix TaxID=2636184 RepID=UPI0025CF233B|nr:MULTISPECIES: hypothetical protein [unclassified Thiothrix]HRJ53330.1 hypothetical protein [Candidatus Thiothrix moscowensis]HRJ94169.1 hypothetical protein [Candidatus Thiothrix moscowensis]
MEAKDGINKILKLNEELLPVNGLWAITGGANHFIRGIVSEINDVDIITTKETGLEISNKFLNYIFKNYEYTQSERIISNFCIIKFNGLNIDVMADPVNLIGDKWVVNKEWSNSIEIFNAFGMSFPLTTLKYELYIYNLLGHFDRVRLLRSFLEE